MGRRTAVNSIVLGVLLMLGVAAVVGRTWSPDQRAAEPVGATAAGPADPLTAAVEAAQQRLSEVPGDHRTWAALGFAYVELARVTADPSYYAKAEGALDESLALHGAANDLALTGMGALANARHDFAAAADLVGQALAVNPYSAAAWGVLTDARTQLGDYAGAREALDRMLTLQPGVASFTRASYDAELHGGLPDAVAALGQALDRAASPSEEAFCRTYLGVLAFSSGDLDEASRQFIAGLAIVPRNPELLLGQARVMAARGEEGGAVQAYRSAVDARPLAESLAEFGEYLMSIGREDEAHDQFALVDTVRRLFDANGVRDDLGVALFAADHGDPATAVAAAEAEFDRRQNVDAHDALAWALHSAGRDAEALPHAQQATALGGRNALFLYHRGVIEAALGQDDQARTTLATALATNPYFSPLHAPLAQESLSSLGGPP